jgi:hypothetical protein
MTSSVSLRAKCLVARAEKVLLTLPASGVFWQNEKFAEPDPERWNGVKLKMQLGFRDL